MATNKEALYEAVERRIGALTEGERDGVVLMATVCCELHHTLPHFHWTGFYRVTAPRMLAIGPYQGGHGCLRIPFEKGVCGCAARERRTVRVDDVEQFPGHIACSASTRSELVVPVMNAEGRLLAVLDIDSDLPAAFDGVDEHWLERICARMGRQWDASA